MASRLNVPAFLRFLLELVAAERAMAEQYRRALHRSDDFDLALRLKASALAAEHRADSVTMLLADLGFDSSDSGQPPPVIATLQNENFPDDDIRTARWLDYQGLLLAEEWHSTAVESLRAVATVTENPRLASLVGLLDDERGARQRWLTSLMACAAAGLFAPQLPGTAPLPHPERSTSSGAMHMPTHGDEFTLGPDATPI